MNINYKNSNFLTSAACITQCPDSAGEVAFVGRSNAGKSSALNYLTNSKIARISKTPGRTQLINFFSISEEHFLVDLPGYGYAKVSKAEQQKWHKFIADYLAMREPLLGIMIVMDCRHPLQKSDEQMLDYCSSTNLNAHIILTKADKLSKSKQKEALFKLQKTIKENWKGTSISLLSSTKRIGNDDVVKVLDNWFGVKEVI